MVITEEHLTMQYILIALELNLLKIEKSKRIKNIITHICRIKAYDSMMCGYFCIGFIAFMLTGKSYLNCINLFSPHDYEKNDEIMSKYFQ